MSAPPRRFSTAQLREAAAELSQAGAAPSVDGVLRKLHQIDTELDTDFKALSRSLSLARADAARARADLAEETRLRAALEAQLRAVRTPPRESPKRLSGGKPLQPRGADVPFRARSGRKYFGVCPCAGKENGDVARADLAVGERLPTCALRHGVLRDMPTESLCELLVAREEAYRVQQGLVERLKSDNRELKGTYDKLWARYQSVYRKKTAHVVESDASVDDRIEHLSFRVQQAGQAVCNVASQVEQRLQLTAEDVCTFRNALTQNCDDELILGLHDDEDPASSIRLRADASAPCSNTDVSGSEPQPQHAPALQEVTGEYEAGGNMLDADDTEETRREDELFNKAGVELMRTLALQKEAHERLRSTVVELTKELERIQPDNMDEVRKCREELEAAEINLDNAQSELKQKSTEIEDLKKQLKKVLAEYEAVSIAHSYSNAELSKIRATNRAKTKYDRHAKDGIENLHHHRKNYFR